MRSKASSTAGSGVFLRVIAMVVLMGVLWLIVDGREEESIDAALVNCEKTGWRSSNCHPKTLPTEMENFTTPLEGPGFIVDPTNMCKELIKRSNGTEEGNEPWREKGLLYITNDCRTQGNSVLGNHLSRWYILRIITAAAGVTLRSTCDSPVTNRIQHNITFFPSDAIIDNRDQFSWKNICRICATGGDGACKYAHGETENGDLSHAASLIRSDLQGMTKDILAESPNLEMDDVVIHLRCGDIARQKHALYGLVPYHVYTKYIPNGTKSVGIVTAPFKQKRWGWGFGDSDLNEAVVMGARDYIQKAFPDAKVSIRNDENEEMDVAYARQVAAKTLICGPSTFCLYPAIATMGVSYILHSPLFGGSPNWIDELEKQEPERIHYVNDSYLPSSQLYDLNVSDIVAMIKGDLESDDSPNNKDKAQQDNASSNSANEAKKTAGSEIEGSDKGDGPPGTTASEMETFTTPLEPPGFIMDPTNMCKELVHRSNGTEEGKEPWREKGLLYIPNDCKTQGNSVLGNHLSRWYIMRIITAAAGVSLRSTCESAVTNRIQHNITFFPSDTVIDNSNQFSWKKICEVCASGGDGACKYAHGEPKNGDLPHAASLIRSDLQGMTKDILAESPNLEMDDVVIHLRCGDIARQKHALYGLVPYHVYTKYIPNGTKSVGIVTAPFKQNRWGWGFGDSDLNEAVVMGARNYIQKAFPDAKVTIRNDENEEMDVVYARQVAAKTLICGPSTFCLYPAIATMGVSYILHSPLFGGSPNWIDELEKQEPERVHYVNDAYFPSNQLYQMNVSDIVKMITAD